MDIRKVKKLMELLERSGMAEIEIKEGEESVRISRYGNASLATPAPAATPTSAAAMIETTTSAVSTESTPATADGHPITSPMVGTFYASPSPDAEPFIKVGDKIKKGDVVCIVEAMKLMNELPSEIEGEIVEICVQNGEGVSFGQVIAKVK